MAESLTPRGFSTAAAARTSRGARRCSRSVGLGRDTLGLPRRRPTRRHGRQGVRACDVSVLFLLAAVANLSPRRRFRDIISEYFFQTLIHCATIHYFNNLYA